MGNIGVYGGWGMQWGIGVYWGGANTIVHQSAENPKLIGHCHMLIWLATVILFALSSRRNAMGSIENGLRERPLVTWSIHICKTVALGALGPKTYLISSVIVDSSLMAPLSLTAGRSSHQIPHKSSQMVEYESENGFRISKLVFCDFVCFHCILQALCG